MTYLAWSLNRRPKSWKTWFLDLQQRKSLKIFRDFSKIWSALYWVCIECCHEKTFYYTSQYINWTNVSSKIIVLDSLKNAKIVEKNDQDFEPQRKGNKNTFDVCRKNPMRSCYQTRFHKKYWKLLEICWNNSKITHFRLQGVKKVT